MAVVGYKYYFGIHMGIGIGPVDEFLEAKVGGKTAWRGSVKVSQQISINEPELFGGNNKEGGIEGTLDVMMGEPDQTAPLSMTSVFGALPGFRRVFSLYYDGLVGSNNPYPKPWAFRLRRATKGWDGDAWYPEKCVINLIRPVSEGESNAPAFNSTLDLSQIFNGVASGQTRTFDLNGASSGTVVSVQSVYAYVVEDVGGVPSSSNVFMEPGTDWTNIGNEITFVNVPSETLYIMVSYKANIDIEGAGEGGIGDTLIKAMNPAHVIYECLTNREWGRGLPRGKLEDYTFRQSADTLYSENFGFCRAWNRRDEIQVFVQSVLDHIGGVLYEDMTSGLLTLRLIRDDYVQDTLTKFTTENGLLEINDATISALTKMINEVRVTYRDPVTNQDRVVRASNIATLQSSGGNVNILSKDYPGIPTGELATRVAKRDLRAASPGLRRFSLTFDRRAFSLYPGGVVRIEDLQRNIQDMVLRIATIDYGTLQDGRIKVTAVQDVFGTPKRGISTIGPNPWIPPSSNSNACVGPYRLFELPYRSVYRSMSTAEFNTTDNASAFLGIAIGRGNSFNISTNLAVKSGSVDISEIPPNGSYYCGYTP